MPEPTVDAEKAKREADEAFTAVARALYEHRRQVVEILGLEPRWYEWEKIPLDVQLNAIEQATLELTTAVLGTALGLSAERKHDTNVEMLRGKGWGAMGSCSEIDCYQHKTWRLLKPYAQLTATERVEVVVREALVIYTATLIRDKQAGPIEKTPRVDARSTNDRIDSLVYAMRTGIGYEFPSPRAG